MSKESDDKPAQGAEVRVMFLSKNGVVRSVNTDTGFCVFMSGSRLRGVKLRCAATYAARLVEAGWKIDSIEVQERTEAS